MNNEQPQIIENKVANSGLVTINLELFYDTTERVLLDIKPWLFMEMILKEKDFREHLKQHDWSQYQNKLVAVYCSADAIVPTWAYMLVAVQLQSVAKRYVFGDLQKLEQLLFQEAISSINLDEYKDARVIIKGCSDVPVPVYAFVEITNKLLPVAKSIMYGEACSNVPVFKRK
ncbi:MAG: DUF2480 family protein [Bacteroidia bacterium]|jgi:hypothetical protein|nr:DUF2480 family protein [Bacteroidia bacterium]